VFGYSFREDHIRKLFQYEARRNIDSIVILVSPSAHSIYKNELRYFKDDQITKTSLCASKSDLDGRVLCLPYRLELILPKLNKDFLDNLKRADEIYNIQQGNLEKGITPAWIECLKHYSKSEHVYKVDNIASRLGWSDIIKENWGMAFEIAFETFLNSIPSEDNQIIERWTNHFAETCDAFGIGSLNFIPMIGPPKIFLEIKSKYKLGVTIPSLTYLVDSINQIVIFLNKKLILTNQSVQMNDLILSFRRLYAYFKNG
jgi:hypothetical protein